MSTLVEWLSRFAGLVRGNRTSRLAEEFNSHVELLTDDYVRRGMTESDARSAALREVGNFTHIEQEYREQNGAKSNQPWTISNWIHSHSPLY